MFMRKHVVDLYRNLLGIKESVDLSRPTPSSWCHVLLGSGQIETHIRVAWPDVSHLLQTRRKLVDYQCRVSSVRHLKGHTKKLQSLQVDHLGVDRINHSQLAQDIAAQQQRHLAIHNRNLDLDQLLLNSKESPHWERRLMDPRGPKFEVIYFFLNLNLDAQLIGHLVVCLKPCMACHRLRAGGVRNRQHFLLAPLAEGLHSSVLGVGHVAHLRICWRLLAIWVDFTVEDEVVVGALPTEDLRGHSGSLCQWPFRLQAPQ